MVILFWIAAGLLISVVVLFIVSIILCNCVFEGWALANLPLSIGVVNFLLGAFGMVVWVLLKLCGV